jgi:hypothetical protein
MQIKDRDSAETDWTNVDEPRAIRLGHGFRRGLGFVPSSIDEDETVSGSITFDSEPEQLNEKDRIGEETRPRK